MPSHAMQQLQGVLVDIAQASKAVGKHMPMTQLMRRSVTVVTVVTF